MPDDDLRMHVSQLHQQVFGVEGQGGLVREVDSVKAIVADHEKKLNLLSAKWLFLTLLAGAIGSSFGGSAISFLLALKH
jgi:hypothetical protein